MDLSAFSMHPGTFLNLWKPYPVRHQLKPCLDNAWHAGELIEFTGVCPKCVFVQLVLIMKQNFPSLQQYPRGCCCADIWRFAISSSLCGHNFGQGQGIELHGPHQAHYGHPCGCLLHSTGREAPRKSTSLLDAWPRYWWAEKKHLWGFSVHTGVLLSIGSGGEPKRQLLQQLPTTTGLLLKKQRFSWLWWPTVICKPLIWYFPPPHLPNEL